ncbi:MAG TPA: DUF2459 domain-containing protein [Steroidobacteraceae bacterium]|nr:DUF2459 domain-containing protein [Steroidobacteraceae bacterium]
MPPAPPTAPPSFLTQHARRPLEIGVLFAGWHSGIVLPADELGPLTPLLEDNPQARYLNIGWGNRRFYMAAHPGSGDALAALFRSPSALFLQRVASTADLSAEDGQIRWLCADREQLWRVNAYIEEFLSRPRGRLIDLGRGPFPDSGFYASAGHYSMVHTCNTWTVAALEFAGLAVRADGVIFAYQAQARVRELRACPAPQ